MFLATALSPSLSSGIRHLVLAALLLPLGGNLQGQNVVYTGTWNNTTFGSSGTAIFTFTTSGDLIVDLNGPVFGGSDPAPVTLTDAEITATGITYTRNGVPNYGNMSITANFDGTFSYSLTGSAVGNVDGSGSIDTGAATMTYQVPGLSANGTISTSLSSGDPTQVGTPFFFAQFGNGTGAGLTFTSDIVLPNPSSTDTVTGMVAFGSPAGGVLSVDVEGSSLATSVDFTVPPLGSTTISTTGLGDLATGSAVVVADGPLGGVVRFFISDFPGVGSGIAGVPASQPLSGFITPVRRVAGGVNTGIAVRNVGSSTVNLTLSLRENGSEVATSNRSVAGNGQFAEFIETLFAGFDTSNFSGSAVVTSDGMIAATAIEQGTGPGQFTTLPVTALE